MSRQILIWTSALCVLAGPANGADFTKHVIEVGEMERSFYVFTPTKPVSASEPLGAVLVFHGFHQQPDDMRTLTEWEAVADEHGFLVVYPEGYRHSWNDGDDSKPATRQGIDDLGFVESLIEHVVAEFDVDEKRVYATGFSNSGFMLLRNACSLRHRIAAVGIVAAGVYNKVDDFCDGDRAFPAMFILGTKDPAIPWDGWMNSATKPSDSGQIWARMNKCDPQPRESLLQDLENDGTVTERQEYTDCADGATVVFFRVEGGGHTWPGGHQYLPSAMIGRTSQDWSATETIWQFFCNHRLQSITPGLASELRASLGDTTASTDELIETVEDHRRRFPHVAVEFEINRLGYALMREDRPGDGVRALALNTHLFPNSYNAHDSLGEALMRLGKQDAAIRSYRQAVELNPESEHSRKMLNRLLAEESP